MSAITLAVNAGLQDAATGGRTSTVGEPSLGSSGDQLFVTGNWYASRSTDGGASWTHVDPFTALPAAAGGFCCDQVTLHDDARGLWIWILQYIAQDGANVFRIAVTSDGDFASGSWGWWDIAPTHLDAAFAGQWFDYPDAALTDQHLVVTFNMFDASDAWKRASVMRFPLDALAAGGNLSFSHWSTTSNGSLRLTQGATHTMYWASHNRLDQLRLFAWPDAATGLSWWDVPVGAWSGDISSTGPNGVDWLGRADSRITGGAVGNGTITFLWTAGSKPGRPHAYCRCVRIGEASKQVVDEPDIWHDSRAWAYPAAAANADGVLAFTAFHGGADRPPGHVVGVRDDAAGAWTSVVTSPGTHAPGEPKWGDYLTCRRDAPDGSGWVAAGFTLEGGGTRNEVVPRVVRFRREASQPRWQQLDDNPATVQIVADGGALYQRHSSGRVYSSTGTPGTGWQELDDNPATVDIAASGGRLYQRHDSGRIFVYTGSPVPGAQEQDG